MLTVKDLKKDIEVKSLINVTEMQLEALGFTEHSTRHLSIVSNWAGDVIAAVGGSVEEVNSAQVAGYLHDIGNAVNRHDHAQSGALLAYNVLLRMGMSFEDAAEIMMAIGNHDELQGQPVSRISSALIIADKADVHRSRVRKNKQIKNLASDIHDRVNYAAESSHLDYDNENKVITLNLTIDTTICSVMDYFEIYFGRMKMCIKAADYFGWRFSLSINGNRML